MQTIPPALLTQPITGINLHDGSLADQLADTDKTLIVFLRHFG